MEEFNIGNVAGEKINESKPSDTLLTRVDARSAEIENKALEMLKVFVLQLPELQDQLDRATENERETALQQYFKKLDDIEKCAHAMRQARQQRIDAATF